MSWYAPFQSSQTRQQLFMFSFYRISPTDDMNHKLLSSFYLMTSKNILSSYSHGSLLLLKYLMLTCLFIRQCSQKSPWNTKTWKKLSVLLEYFTRGFLQTVKLRSAYHGCYSTWLAKMFWYHHLKSNNQGSFVRSVSLAVLLASSFTFAADPGKLLPCVPTNYLLPRTWKQNLWVYLALILLQVSSQSFSKLHEATKQNCLCGNGNTKEENPKPTSPTQ